MIQFSKKLAKKKIYDFFNEERLQLTRKLFFHFNAPIEAFYENRTGPNQVLRPLDSHVLPIATLGHC